MGKILKGFDYLGSWNKESYDMRKKLLTHWVLLFVYNHGNHNYEPTIPSYNHSNNNQTQKRFYNGVSRNLRVKFPYWIDHFSVSTNPINPSSEMMIPSEFCCPSLLLWGFYWSIVRRLNYDYHLSQSSSFYFCGHSLLKIRGLSPLIILSVIIQF